MAANRLLYLGLLALSAIFYFASGVWFSWLLLVLVLVLPLLSFLLSLPGMLSCRLQAALPRTVEQGESASLRLQLSAWKLLPLPDVQLRLNLRTRDRERDLRYLSRLSRADGLLALSTERCGFLAPEFRRGRVYDALGLFWLPLRLPKLEPMAILPTERQPDPMPRLEQFLQQQVKPKPGGGYAELHDHRAYRPGDPVKSIHWKLSMKTDQLVVREPLEPVKRRMLLALRTPRGAQARAINLGQLRYLSHWLLDHGVAHELVWMEGQQLRTRPVEREEQLPELLREICLAPENSVSLPKPLPVNGDWVCPVGVEGRLES